MDGINPPSPASSSASDSDAYNTESARLYFGPFKTPERKFIATSKSLFPPPQPAAVRRSPRLSSPRIRSASPMDVQGFDEDGRDIEQVAQLVNNSDEDEEDSLETGGGGTPQTGGDLLPDEPSSALADRVIHALDNPSPPPSPPTTLRDFDPYHTTASDGPTDYQTDLMSLKINDGPENEDESPFSAQLGNKQSMSLLWPTVTSDNNAPPFKGALIDIDSFSSLPSGDYDTKGAARMSTSLPQPILSVDDLLSQSPIIETSTSSQPRPEALAGSTDFLLTSQSVANETQMLIDASSTPGETSGKAEILAVVLNSPIPGAAEINLPSVADSSLPSVSTENLLVTPLRRSTRPRRSVTPTPAPIAPVFIPPPSIARTQVKKKLSTPGPDDEFVDSSQAEEQTRRSSSPNPTVRVRHRSPGKAPLSFRRELGSLSPTSSNVLSTLAFVPPPDSLDGTDTTPNQNETPPKAAPTFSFSVFAPLTDAPSTPVRSTGPIRFTSPAKGSSPNKYQIHTPAPGDPTNTPARRIPIAEGIAQGYVSPEKADKLGYQPNGTPLPSIPTPARRVLVTESAAPAMMKSSNLRPASPLKRMLGQRDTSLEPPQRLGASIKGKEKAAQLPQERPTLPRLPYPLTLSMSSSTVLSTSSGRSVQDNVAKAKASPAKSNLRQPTSRIPRIGTKPYARTEPKIGPKASIVQTTELRPPSKTSMADIARQNARESTKTLASSSTSRLKSAPTMSMSSTILKRKREPEKASPAKPRIIMLRQVPVLPVQPTEPAPAVQVAAPSTAAGTAASKAKKAPVRIRRVMDPEPLAIVAQASPPEQSKQCEAEADPTVKTTLQSTEPPPSLRVSPPLAQNSNTDLPPGSPMAQDPPAEPQVAPDPPNEEDIVVSRPPSTATTSNDAGASSLRRTTRSRRTAINQDVFQEGSSRTTSTRRKTQAFRSDDIFSGMSITALKDLTVSNTVRNQKYIAAKLETEVIRKEGIRPESPAVKIRTIVQRQQEERDRERAERANRRARRSGEDMASSDIEGSVDVGSSSAPDDQISEDDDGNGRVRHMRGAGEDDDYETPEIYRHLKRTRLFGESGEEMEVERRRRVKWDRGLFTTVYLDEVKLGSRQTLKENRALKGILAPTAKALRLDTLGNLPHADSPLSDIVQENITVKKIVYDSDVSAAVAEVVSAAKNTRARSKKK
ncbi:hypothetical protein BDN70DRAFT_881294 [Pholiota conissans]|uniref:Uncharacterized protein n=1 Tax=Pholiota conissans TaxID=109636 RepID=A0A9P5YX83_9AGAR|nr:hypothetical protein BDN70DRAFT_881294 [Pholiota conissans]